MSRAPLNQASGMPQMGRAFAGWTKTITLIRRQQQVGTLGIGLISTIDTPFTFNGTIQPLGERAIMLKPEGQRAWQWLQIHSFSGVFDLAPTDEIVYNGKSYKVMATRDYSLNGYVEYHIVYDYQS